jgi:hypothetical protein
MFGKSKLIRLALVASVALAWLPIGDVWKPAEANAFVIVRGGPIVRPIVRPVLPAPIIRVGPVAPAPVVGVGTVVPVGPVYPCSGYGWHWNGFRWVR